MDRSARIAHLPFTVPCPGSSWLIVTFLQSGFEPPLTLASSLVPTTLLPAAALCAALPPPRHADDQAPVVKTAWRLVCEQ